MVLVERVRVGEKKWKQQSQRCKQKRDAYTKLRRVRASFVESDRDKSEFDT